MGANLNVILGKLHKRAVEFALALHSLAVTILPQQVFSVLTIDFGYFWNILARSSFKSSPSQNRGVGSIYFVVAWAQEADALVGVNVRDADRFWCRPRRQRLLVLRQRLCEHNEIVTLFAVHTASSIVVFDKRQLNGKGSSIRQ